MERTPREHLDIYICAIKGEESMNFWMWFLDMWVRVHPEMVTNPWECEFKASVFACYKVCIGYLLVDACIWIPQQCLEQWLDWNGGQAAKDDVAASYRQTPSPETDNSSSETDSSSGNSEASSQYDTWSASPSRANSDLGWADNGYETEATGAKNTSKGKKVGFELRLRAKTRLLYWHAALPTGHTDNACEWERLDVDAWVEATGYDEVEAEARVTSLTVSGVTTRYDVV